jgi:hypothetical protein
MKAKIKYDGSLGNVDPKIINIMKKRLDQDKNTIAYTSTGKPIYKNAGNRAHKNFTGKEHHEAYVAHYVIGERIRDKDNDGEKQQYHYSQQCMHRGQFEAHETLGEKIPSFDESIGSVKIKGD